MFFSYQVQTSGNRLWLLKDNHNIPLSLIWEKMKLLIFIYSLNKKIEEIIEGKESIMYLKNKIFFLVMCSMLVLYTQLFNKMSKGKEKTSFSPLSGQHIRWKQPHQGHHYETRTLGILEKRSFRAYKQVICKCNWHLTNNERERQ